MLLSPPRGKSVSDKGVYLGYCPHRVTVYERASTKELRALYMYKMNTIQLSLSGGSIQSIPVVSIAVPFLGITKFTFRIV